MQGAVFVLLILLIPAAAAPLALLMRNPHVRKVFVITVSVAMMASAILLAVTVLSHGPLVIKSDEARWAGPLVTVIDALALVAILYFGVKLKEWKIIVPSLLQVAAAVYIEVFARPAEPEYLINIDQLSLVMVLIASIIGPLVAIFALGYMQKHEEHGHSKHGSRQHIFFAVIFMFLTAMNAISISDNFMHLYAFWEITTLCSFLLIGYDQNRKSHESAKRALWLNAVGGLFFAAGIVLLVATTGSVSISGLIAHGSLTAVMTAGVLFICCAGFVKSAQLPFQSWLLGAMVAPTPVSALLHSSTMVKAGVYIVVRLSPLFGGKVTGDLVALVGAFTFMAASAIAISQSNGKRVLAYSTIANLGLIIACAGLGGPEALAAAILLMIYHAVSKGLLFLCMGTVELGIGSRNIEDMFGIYSKMPYTTTIMGLGMISMILPPFGVLITKWLALEAAVYFPPVLVLIVLGSAFTIAFWVKWLGAILTVYKPKKTKIEKLPFSMIATLGVIGVIIPVLTGMISVLNDAVVSPAVKTLLNFASPIYGSGGGIYMAGSGRSVSGGFSGVLLLLGVLIAMVLVIFIATRTKTRKTVKPYACGENVGEDVKGRDFIGPKDEKLKVRMHNYYMEGVFSEQRLLPIACLISMLLILIMFGVS